MHNTVENKQGSLYKTTVSAEVDNLIKGIEVFLVMVKRHKLVRAERVFV